MTDAKRQTLKQKVATGQARVKQRTKGDNTTTIVDRAGEKAIEAKDKVFTFAKEHPIATVAGAVVVGALVSTLFKRSPTREVATKAAGRASGLAVVGAQLALTLAQQAMSAASQAAKAGAYKFDGVGDGALDFGRDAAGKAGKIGESAAMAARDAGKRLTQAWRER
ncbi:MAG: hypothetical protein J7493_05170 [Porphyrobacter sp.]|nr:hypothetical protein [Porphyrobacter sp.]